MNKVKVWWHGKRLRDMYVGATWFEVLKWRLYRFLRKAVILSFIGGMVFGAFKLGSMTTADITYAAPVTIEVVRKAPVLDRIAKCESGGSHLDKNGQVIINTTRDAGKYQINVPIWGKKATELGYNLMIEEDNEAFAHWLYENYGTEPWIHSAKCWR